MQTNPKNKDFKKISIEVLASNPRNGQMLIEALVKFLDYQNFNRFKDNLETAFTYALGSPTFVNEVDPIELSNLFFAYNRILELFNNLENAMNTIAPNSIYSIEFTSNQIEAKSN